MRDEGVLGRPGEHPPEAIACEVEQDPSGEEEEGLRLHAGRKDSEGAGLSELAVLLQGTVRS